MKMERDLTDVGEVLGCVAEIGPAERQRPQSFQNDPLKPNESKTACASPGLFRLQFASSRSAYQMSARRHIVSKRNN